MLADVDSGNILSVLFWTVVTIAALIAGYVVVMRVKNWLSGPDVSSAPLGFTLSDLRKMHAAGQMSDEEFEKAKSRTIEASKKLMEKPPAKDVKPKRPPNYPHIGQ